MVVEPMVGLASVCERVKDLFREPESWAFRDAGPKLFTDDDPTLVCAHPTLVSTAGKPCTHQRGRGLKRSARKC